MKNILLALGVVLISFSADAQFSKGRFLVGGSIGFGFDTEVTENDNNSDTKYQRTEFTVEPQFGYFVIDRLAIGAGLSITNSRTNYLSSDDIATRREATITPMVRYYLPNRIFFQIKVPLGSSTNTYDNGSNFSKVHYGVSGLSLGMGYAVRINNNVTIEPLLQYNFTSYNDKDSSRRYLEKSLDLRAGFQIYLGN